jgi:hypothetical protein
MSCSIDYFTVHVFEGGAASIFVAWACGKGVSYLMPQTNGMSRKQMIPSDANHGCFALEKKEEILLF